MHAHHVLEDEARGRFSRDERGGDDDVHLRSLRAEQRHLRINEGLRHGLGCEQQRFGKQRGLLKLAIDRLRKT